MSTNKFKVKSNDAAISGGFSVFSSIERKLKLETYFEEGFPVHYLPKIFFVLVLGLIYIGNKHYAELTVRKSNKMQVEVEDRRDDNTVRKRGGEGKRENIR